MARKKAESKKAETSSAPTAVVDLVARFREHADAYHAGRYNETQIRREFIDPFFKALGWDVWNEQGHAEAYKDVIHEDAINVGGATKAPDYCFRIGGVRKFFVEAKKPSVDIKADAGPAFQLRRYAWSAKLPLSILTDFEEIAVYDCRVKPVRSDKASTARVLYFRYEGYPQRWDELASIFSREAILKGSFDKYAKSTRRKRGTAEVDDAFLAEIEQWRDMLARNLALRNPDLTQRDLNFAVQRTIDRIVFLRICEDRGIERYGTLQALCATQTEPQALARGQHAGPVAHAQGSDRGKLYQRLFERFRRADERYNSGLFHFTRERGRPEEPDDLTPALTLDDKPLKELLARLYYPESPYEFSVLPADILGQVYEQFLGKVIRLTKGHRAVVEEKPEVRKAGGVYYTPTYIVDYIVKHTVGKLVEGKTPQQVGGLTDTFQPSKAKGVRPLTVLDPACGSGSFLLGAYQFLLDWYRDRYLEDGPEAHATGRNPRLFQHPSGDWRLTTAQRKRILLSHIHGVDIDSQAVETTKLSLLLKVLEGESAETIGSSLRLFHERALPDLAGNIKCGNSLIGPDFYDNQQMALFDEEERYRINVFDWQAEFPQVFDQNPERKRRANQYPERKRRANQYPERERRAEQYPERQRLADQYPERQRRARHAVEPDGVGPVADARGSDRGLDPHSGFDAVIGNPPYIRVRYFKDIHPEQADYLEAHYTCATHVWDIYLLVFERALSICRTGGRCGFIVPIQTLHQPNCESLRRVLYQDTSITNVTDCSDLVVFKGPIVKNCILVTERGTKEGHHIAVSRPQATTDFVQQPNRHWPQSHVASNPGFSLKTDLLSPKRLLCSKLADLSYTLGDLCYTTFGLRSCAKGKGKGGKDRLITDDPDAPHARPYLEGRDIGRYSMRPTGRYIQYLPDEMYSPRTPVLFEAKKLVSQTMLSKIRLVATLDDQGYYVEQSLLCIIPHGILTPCVDLPQYPLEFVLGIVNSTLSSFYYATWIIDYSLGGGLVHATPGSQGKLLVPKVAPTKTVGIVERVRDLLDLHKELAAAKTAHAKTAIQRQIDATDRQIDRLVYELYGLTDDEIRIVEEATT